MHKVVAFIPVRGGSKSIPLKNIKILAGKPLVYWTAKAASDCAGIDAVYVSTDDAEIARTVESLCLPKVSVVGRSAETATDTASTESALLEFAEQTACERIVLIQATSPLLSTDDLSGGLKMFIESDADSLLSTVEQKRFIWNSQTDGSVVPVNYDPLHRPRRQDFEGFLVENGAFYIMSRDGLLKSRNRLYGRVVTWKMDAATFVEIDEPDDWLLVEHELRKRSFVTSDSIKARLAKIKLVLTDVDGVLTDAGMYYSENGDELKKFNTRDGKGFELLRKAGIRTGILTSENTKLVSRRAAKLKLDYIIQGAVDKLPALQELMKSTNLAADEIAYIGDDLADIPVLKVVGVGACPSDAVNEVTAAAIYYCKSAGGQGCLREFAEYILSRMS